MSPTLNITTQKVHALIMNSISAGKGGMKNGAATKAASARDTLSISDKAKLLRDQLAFFNALTSVKGKQIVDLKAINNVLTFEAGAYYRFQFSECQSAVVKSYAYDMVRVPYEDIAGDLGEEFDIFPPETTDVFEKAQWFLTALCDKSTWHLRTDYTRQEVLDNCAKLGIEPGGWVEINNQGKTNRFYLEEDGTPWPEYQVEAAREAWTTGDHRVLHGLTEGAVLIVNGKEYVMNENGNFDIPKGEPVIYSNGMVVFPKEIGEYMRAKYNWPEPTAEPAVEEA